MDLDTTLVVHSSSSEGPSVPSKEQSENTIDIVSQKDKTAKASGLSNLADAQYANRIKRNAKICELLEVCGVEPSVHTKKMMKETEIYNFLF